MSKRDVNINLSGLASAITILGLAFIVAQCWCDGCVL